MLNMETENGWHKAGRILWDTVWYLLTISYLSAGTGYILGTNNTIRIFGIICIFLACIINPFSAKKVAEKIHYPAWIVQVVVFILTVAFSAMLLAVLF